MNEGRLRLTSSGVTTADTLLPSAEAILRDLLLGQEWLRANGMTQEPRLAYFTDSFGCSPALPSILQAAGFEQAELGASESEFEFFGFHGSRSSLLLPGTTVARVPELNRAGGHAGECWLGGSCSLSPLIGVRPDRRAATGDRTSIVSTIRA